MIHYHGTPITPRAEFLRMAGNCFCVSYATGKALADTAVAIGQSVMWDNGAFSAFRAGRLPDFDGYYEWIEPRLAHPHWAVVPDVIDGSESDQRSMRGLWPFRREFGAAVWHMGLSIDSLLEIAAEWPRVCFGSSGNVWNVGSPAWERRCDEAWDALAARGLTPWVHMLRGMSVAGGARWPFASADSVNVARNFKDEPRKHPEVMAAAINRAQTPVRWTIRGDLQSDLFGAEK